MGQRLHLNADGHPADCQRRHGQTTAAAALTALGGLSTTTAASTYATITNLALKAPLASPTFTGTVTIPAGSLNTVTITNSNANNMSIGATTPNTGAFTTITATGLISPSSTVGIKGTAAIDNAQAGSVGEFPAPTDLSAVSLTSNASANCSSISLTAGDWEVGGMVQISAAATTVISNSFGGVSTTSATLGALGTYWQIANNFSAGALIALTVPTTRISIASTTTVFLVANAGFTTSTATASCKMHIRRPR